MRNILIRRWWNTAYLYPIRARKRYPDNPWRTAERGSHLVSLRDALECLFAELVASAQFRERLLRGPEGNYVPHTTIIIPVPELPYKQHADEVADLHLCLGLEKGGGGTSTDTLVATTPNQAHLMSRSSSILL